jgi:hypothetical protein
MIGRRVVFLPYLGVSAMPQQARRTTNHILSDLSSKDRALLEPDLETIDLPVRFQIAGRNKRIQHVYFLDEGDEIGFCQGIWRLGPP